MSAEQVEPQMNTDKHGALERLKQDAPGYTQIKRLAT
jgi:hypothetical protein